MKDEILQVILDDDRVHQNKLQLTNAKDFAGLAPSPAPSNINVVLLAACKASSVANHKKINHNIEIEGQGVKNG